MDAVTYALAGQALVGLDEEGGRWKEKTTGTGMPVDDGNSVVALSGDRLLVTGGAYVSGAAIYDPVSDTWTARQSMASNRGYLATAALGGDRAIATGGMPSYSSPVKTTERYDDVANSWTARASLVVGVYDHRAVSLSGDRALIMGGQTGSSTRTDMVQLYDDAANTFTNKSALPEAISQFCAALLSGDRVLVTNGTTVSRIYDSVTNTWTVIAMPPESVTTGTSIGGDRVLVVHAVGDKTATAYRYDPTSNTWKQRETVPYNSVAGRYVLVAISGGKAVLVRNKVVTVYEDVPVAVSKLLSTIQSWAATR